MSLCSSSRWVSPSRGRLTRSHSGRVGPSEHRASRWQASLIRPEANALSTRFALRSGSSYRASTMGMEGGCELSSRATSSFRPYKGARINSIERFVRNQHSRGVSWSVLSLDGPNGRQRVRATFSLALRVRQRGAAVSEGFVDLGVSCRSGRVVRWSGNVAAPPGKVNAPAVSQDFAVQGTDPGLVARCKPDLIETQLRQMLEAFNRGLGWTFESNFQPADRFDAYNGSRHLGHRYPVGIVPFVRARWSAGDGWTALALRPQRGVQTESSPCVCR